MDARALVDRDTCVFIAFSKSFKKRVLHTLKLKDNLSLFEERNLYLEESASPQGKTSVFRLLSERFTSEDSVAIYLMYPPSGYVSIWGGPGKLRDFGQHLRTMSSQLPFVPRALEVYTPPAYADATIGGKPMSIEVTSQPKDPQRGWIVVMDKCCFLNMT